MLAFTVTHHAAILMNRWGILIGFFSFWFAAPEFIGEERLKMWEKTLAQVSGNLPKIVMRTAISCSVATLILMVAWDISATFFRTDPASTFIGSIIDSFYAPAYSDNTYWFIIVAVIVLMTPVITAFYHIFIHRFVARIVSGLVIVLAHDKKQRQRSLFLGAFLFILATIIQFL